MIDGGNFYDQLINDSIKQCDEAKNNYTTECSLDCAYFKDNYRLIAVDLSKQKAFDADPRAIQQTVFQGAVGGADNTK